MENVHECLFISVPGNFFFYELGNIQPVARPQEMESYKKAFTEFLNNLLFTQNFNQGLLSVCACNAADPYLIQFMQKLSESVQCLCVFVFFFFLPGVCYFGVVSVLQIYVFKHLMYLSFCDVRVSDVKCYLLEFP